MSYNLLWRMMISLKSELDSLDMYHGALDWLSPLFCRIRLVAVATQKFVTEVASDALQYVSKF